MGWLRLVGSLKLWVSFAEHRLFYRALLQMSPAILRSLLVVATPYVVLCLGCVEICVEDVRFGAGVCHCACNGCVLGVQGGEDP